MMKCLITSIFLAGSVRAAGDVDSVDIITLMMMTMAAGEDNKNSISTVMNTARSTLVEETKRGEEKLFGTELQDFTSSLLGHTISSSLHPSSVSNALTNAYWARFTPPCNARHTTDETKVLDNALASFKCAIRNEARVPTVDLAWIIMSYSRIHQVRVKAVQVLSQQQHSRYERKDAFKMILTQIKEIEKDVVLASHSGFYRKKNELTERSDLHRYSQLLHCRNDVRKLLKQFKKISNNGLSDEMQEFIDDDVTTHYENLLLDTREQPYDEDESAFKFVTSQRIQVEVLYRNVVLWNHVKVNFFKDTISQTYESAFETLKSIRKDNFAGADLFANALEADAKKYQAQGNHIKGLGSLHRAILVLGLNE